MSQKQIFILLLTLAAALALRLYFVPAPGYERDIQLFKIWSQTAVENGVHNVYDKTWCDYPPGYLYVLKALGSFYHCFYPNFEEHTYLFDFLMKLPGILADLLISAIVFLFLRRRLAFRFCLLAAAAYAFNPVIFFNSAYWGQVDSFSSLIALLSIIALLDKRFGWSWALFALAITVKTQLVSLLPILLLLTWRQKGGQSLGFCFLIAAAVFGLVAAPFLYFHQADRVIDRILNAVGEYPFLSMNAYNFWWLIGAGQARGLPDTHLFLNLLTYRTLSAVLLGLFFALLLNYLFPREKDEAAVFLSCALAIFAFFMLPTEMHERYIVPVFPFLLLAAVGRFDLKIIYFLLSATGFLNLFYSLVRTYPNNFPLIAHCVQSFPVDLGLAFINLMVLGYFIFRLMKEIKIKYLGYSLLITGLVLTGLYLSRPREVYLDTLEPESYYQEWGTLNKNRSLDKNQLIVQGYIFPRGLGTHAKSSIVYHLGQRYNWLEGLAGLDDEQNRGNKLEFSIYADDKLIYRSGILQGWVPPRYFRLPIAKVTRINLTVENGGDGINYDHADWLNIKVSP